MQLVNSIIEGAIRLEWGPICVILGVVFWTYQFVRWILSFCDWLFGFSIATNIKVGEELTVSKVEFVRQVVSWCSEYLGMPPKINRLPNITMRYYRHSKWSGLYSQYNKEITIYWDNHWDLLTLINTVIHEYQHFLDLRNSKDDQEYAKELAKVGYYKNIYEKRARKTASIWERQCYEAMLKKGVIKK